MYFDKSIRLSPKPPSSSSSSSCRVPSSSPQPLNRRPRTSRCTSARLSPNQGLSAKSRSNESFRPLSLSIPRPKTTTTTFRTSPNPLVVQGTTAVAPFHRQRRISSLVSNLRDEIHQARLLSESKKDLKHKRRRRRKHHFDLDDDDKTHSSVVNDAAQRRRADIYALNDRMKAEFERRYETLMKEMARKKTAAKERELPTVVPTTSRDDDNDYDGEGSSSFPMLCCAP